MRMIYDLPNSLLATSAAGVSLPPLREHTPLRTLLVPAGASGVVFGICIIPLLAVQVGKDATGCAPRARATTLVQSWHGWGGV